MKATILSKVNNMLADETVEDTQINEYIDIITDRLRIRLDSSSFPESFYSIAADAVVKMYRRFYYEGISSESDGVVSVSFADDVLSEYAGEIAAYKDANKKVVRFI